MKYFIQSIIISILGVLALMCMYYFGAYVAAEMGRNQRGGVSWGVGIYFSFYIFAIVLFIHSYVSCLTKVNKLTVLAITLLIYTAISFWFFGNNFSGKGWNYPYRYSYYMVCSYAVLAAVTLMKKFLDREAD